MEIPKFYEFMKPILINLADCNTHTLKELRPILANAFSLTNEDTSKLLPSGSQTIFANRVQWAGTYLFKAGLISKPSRGVFLITEEGKKVLEENPPIIDVDYLLKYDSFKEFQSPTTEKTITENTSETPNDTFEDAFKKINDNLADDLLSEVMKLSAVAFEQMVIDLLQKMGYGAFKNSGKTTPVTGDEGIDGIIMEDKLGFNLIYIQAKKWDLDATVSRPDIQSFVGAIAGKGGNGLFVTTAKYSKPAIDYADQHHIILIDGKRLSKLMIEHNFAVTVKKTFEIKEIDTDIFNEYTE